MTPPTAGLLLTGSELLLGLIADEHTRYLARELERLGVGLRRVILVGDEHDEIARGLGALADCDLVITAGGLGPTHDDLTMAVVAETVGAELRLDGELHDTIAAITAGYARRRGIDPAINAAGDRKQALVPAGALVLPPAGTAPGVVASWGSRLDCVLPGPPRELRAIWADAVATGALDAVLGWPSRSSGERCASRASASRASRTRSSRPAAMRAGRSRRSARASWRSR